MPRVPYQSDNIAFWGNPLTVEWGNKRKPKLHYEQTFESCGDGNINRAKNIVGKGIYRHLTSSNYFYLIWHSFSTHILWTFLSTVVVLRHVTEKIYQFCGYGKRLLLTFNGNDLGWASDV